MAKQINMPKDDYERFSTSPQETLGDAEVGGPCYRRGRAVLAKKQEILAG